VNEESGGLDCPVAGDAVAGGVHRHNVGRHHFRPMKALGIDQESVPVQCIAEMVADPFMQSHLGGGAQGTGKIDLVLFDSHQ